MAALATLQPTCSKISENAPRAADLQMLDPMLPRLDPAVSVLTNSMTGAFNAPASHMLVQTMG